MLHQVHQHTIYVDTGTVRFLWGVSAENCLILSTEFFGSCWGDKTPDKRQH